MSDSSVAAKNDNKTLTELSWVLVMGVSVLVSVITISCGLTVLQSSQLLKITVVKSCKELAKELYLVIITDMLLHQVHFLGIRLEKNTLCCLRVQGLVISWQFQLNNYWPGTCTLLFGLKGDTTFTDLGSTAWLLNASFCLCWCPQYCWDTISILYHLSYRQYYLNLVLFTLTFRVIPAN